MTAEVDGTAAHDGRRGGVESELVERGKRDGKPLLVEIGIAIALSVAVFLVSQFRRRSRRPRPCPPPLPIPSSAGGELRTSEKDTDGSQDFRNLKNEEANVNGTSNTTTRLSPTSNTSSDAEGFLLPELNDSLVKDFEVSNMEWPKVKEEITRLREMVAFLQERERNLEFQLLDSHGAKQQEATMRELESRLKISVMESKMYSLKIESLKTENQKVESQMVDYAIMKNELGAARAKVEFLKNKFESDREKEKEILASLHERIVSLQHREESYVNNNAELETKLKSLEELENKVIELTTINSRLVEEKSNLAKRFEAPQSSKPSVLESTKVEELHEVNQLRKINEILKEEIEQLQMDRCADVEELVYLKWINACLRYELRNYQPPAGKTVARDLSKSLSLKSEQMAKQLILEYANSGADEGSLNLFEAASEYSSQTSTEEPEDTSFDTLSLTRSSHRAKFLSNLKNLVLGKTKHNSTDFAVDATTPSSARSERKVEDFQEMNQLLKHNQDFSSQINSRLSLDIQTLQRLELEEASTPHWNEKATLSRNEPQSSLELYHDQNNLIAQENTYFPEKAELKKFAGALRSSKRHVQN
ncbi:protein CHUP1, chloroplastic-like [Zingiber officinale]|uniref:Protein CHUP1, chloroplastic n=1 Tax=Zingiber officinale TaxID=94328 RepID=A0A8J5KYJ4_ZINOF|nr:protein CHUP1, chloroplastic-like [Zingiber officinale]KAG6501264.1 hypothetical protein ZIOFF_041143 [Zingiber officinale]